MLKPVLAALALSAGDVAAQAAEIDYGAGKVNSMAPTPGAKAGGDETFNYLALENHVGPSGVPLGGIGVGCFSYAPDGRFTRICINNWHAADQSPRIESTPGTFLAVWRGGQARLLQRGADYAGMSSAKETVYRGLFPTVECRVDDEAVVRAWSGLVPHARRLPCGGCSHRHRASGAKVVDRSTSRTSPFARVMFWIYQNTGMIS
jgi:non-lysosomal glucosylceramidase